MREGEGKLKQVGTKRLLIHTSGAAASVGKRQWPAPLMQFSRGPVNQNR